MINKVLEVQKVLGLNDAEFARSIGYRPQNFNQWKTGESPVPAKAIIRILMKYSEIDANWLIRDIGDVISTKMQSGRIGKGGDIIKDDSSESLQEPMNDYDNLGKLLAEKDARIKDLKSQIETLKEVISALKS